MYRSKFEERFAKSLKKVQFEYETIQIKWEQPAKSRTYTPDFIFKKKDGSFMFIETKGKLTVDDRQKHIWIANQFPELDIRFVFMANNVIRKGSKTRYSDWAKKNGFKYHIGPNLPLEWLDELDIK